MVISSYKAQAVKEIFTFAAFFAADQPEALLTKISSEIPKPCEIP